MSVVMPVEMTRPVVRHRMTMCDISSASAPQPFREPNVPVGCNHALRVFGKTKKVLLAELSPIVERPSRVAKRGRPCCERPVYIRTISGATVGLPITESFLQRLKSSVDLGVWSSFTSVQ